MGELVDAPGEQIPQSDLATPKARQLVDLLQAAVLRHVSFVETRREPKGDVVVFDVEPEVPQDRAADIRSVERMAVTFYDDDDRMPETVALRADFPRDVPHLNLRPSIYSWASLCLYDERYVDLKLRWTAAAFLRRVHEWLSSTARGDLHQRDQRLEPFLLADATPLVIPANLFSAEQEPYGLSVAASGTPEKVVLLARRADAEDESGAPFVVVTLKTEPQVHGVIRHTPTNIRQLHDLVEPLGCDLLNALRQRLAEWSNDDGLLNSRLVLVLWLPQQRSASSAVEATDVWAFGTSDVVRDIGEGLGLWEARIQDGEKVLGGIVGLDETRTGESVYIEILRPVVGFSRAGASALSGSPAESPRIAAIGAGALGSQVIMNLARAGYGDWTIVDDDYLLPHNLARHLLPAGIGFSKATLVEMLVNGLFDEDVMARAIEADVLSTESNEDLRNALKEVDVILDMSASATVARHLAISVPSDARRASLFLNPDGTDLVLLVEDRERRCRLDDLEMQYYREIVRRPELAGHLLARGQRLRYGQSCRDVTATISQELLGISAGIGARALREAMREDEAVLSIWRTSDELGVEVTRIGVSHATASSGMEWTLRMDEGLIRCLQDLRAARLPSETGGVLVGHHDVQRKILYAVDALPAPPDSKERPFYFDRGCAGLRENVQSIEDQTGGALVYVGEWHSHPEGAALNPSEDDGNVFDWLSEHLTQDGLPPLMMIVGKKSVACYLEQLP